MYPHDTTTTRKLRQRAPQIHPGLTRTSSFFPTSKQPQSSASHLQLKTKEPLNLESPQQWHHHQQQCVVAHALHRRDRLSGCRRIRLPSVHRLRQRWSSLRVELVEENPMRRETINCLGCPCVEDHLCFLGFLWFRLLLVWSFHPRVQLWLSKASLLGGFLGSLSLMKKTGWRTYRRPDEKSGGHGVGWSPIIPYTFSVPPGWEEVPVSIADLGGTEIDLRFANSKEGRLFFIVAPVLRFSDDLGDNATIEKIGTPEKVINAFGPDMIGEDVEGRVLSTQVAEHSGRKYYQFELEPPHIIITATAAGNRLYLFNVTANGLQWKRRYGDLKRIASSFRVV